MLKWTLIVVGILIALAVLVVILGYLFPREHTASSSIVLPHPPDSVWMAVRDLGGAAEWWPAVERVEPVERTDGREAWRQHLKTGPLPVVVLEDDPPRKLVTGVDAAPSAAFGGTWTYEIEPAQAGAARVRITERGYINNSFFRFMANVFFGMHGTMDSYLIALGRKFDVDVEPQHGS